MKSLICLMILTLITAVSGEGIDLKPVEVQFRKILIDVQRNSDAGIPLKGASLKKLYPDGTELPEEFDSRSRKIVGNAKKQGACGCCWAFAITACTETSYASSKGRLLDISEQDLINCNEGGWGCNAGYSSAGEYFVKKGFALERDCPYVFKQQNCKLVPKAGKIEICFDYADIRKLSPSLEPLQNLNLQNGGVMWQMATTHFGNPEYGIVDIEYHSFIKQIIYHYGSVMAYVASSTSGFKGFSGGVLFTKQSDKEADHALQVIGWNDKDGCWIVKNSYGTTWGDAGFMRLAYGAANFSYLGAAYVYKLKN